MFTLGIFTTHIPHILMVVFYAYFLLFGVNRAAEGDIQIAEQSVIIKIHTDNSVETATNISSCFYMQAALASDNESCSKIKTKQKLKHIGVDKIFPQDLHENALFSRPPPVLA